MKRCWSAVRATAGRSYNLPGASTINAYGPEVGLLFIDSVLWAYIPCDHVLSKMSVVT